MSNQIKQFKRWNIAYDLGFTDKDIKALGKEPEGAILTWSLGSLGKTIEKKVEIMKTVLDFNYLNEILFDDTNVKLLKGKSHKHLKWIWIDTEANSGKAPTQCEEQNLAGLELLDLACQYPETVKRMEGDNYKYWNLGGIKVTVPGRDAWQAVPILYWNQDLREVRLYAFWDGRLDPDCSVPVSRDSAQLSETQSLASLGTGSLDERPLTVGDLKRFIQMVEEGSV